MESIAAAAPAIGMLGAFACALGGGYLIATRRDVKRGWLLIIMATVLVANVSIWTL